MKNVILGLKKTFFGAKIDFFAIFEFLKWQKINFCTRKSLKLSKNPVI